jgi:hypothetical protein
LEFVRVSAKKFFSPRSGGMVGDEETLILDAYRLARFYHQSPDHFLAMTLSEIQLHLGRTIQLTRIMRAEASSDDD